ncbi:Uncharacterized protein Fot_36783 [Forsythia ovata]|uniref:Uncharacterized protein n=1 Tax=Forsythia ovata TaxID=205694 RepID=A0ABD1SQL1_9LAMI
MELMSACGLLSDVLVWEAPSIASLELEESDFQPNGPSIVATLHFSLHHLPPPPTAGNLSQPTSQTTKQNKKEISTHPPYPSTVAGKWQSQNSSPNFNPKIPVTKFPPAVAIKPLDDPMDDSEQGVGDVG